MKGPAAAGVEAWHAYTRDVSEARLDAQLAEDVVFLSPVVHTPQKGKDVTKLYLMAAFNVFPGGDAAEKRGAALVDGDVATQKSGQATGSKFRYVREVIGEHDAVLEFETEIDGLFVNGVDMIRWNDAGKIVEFKVMIRPLKAIQKVHANMGRMLEALKN